MRGVIGRAVVLVLVLEGRLLLACGADEDPSLHFVQ